MKYMMLLGGLLGFVSVFGVALAVGKTPMAALWQASWGSMASGLLFLWIGNIWTRNITKTLLEKRQAALAAMAEAEERNRKDTKAGGATPV